MEKRLTEKVFVWAHRGASAYAPENSLEAFKMAAEMGADGIELDVHLSADGEIMVIHDAKIDRTSNGKGEVNKYTFEELRVFDYFGAFADSYKKVKIPTLREVYELIRPYPGMVVNVELKPGGDSTLSRKCYECAASCGMSDRVVYSSFDHFHLDWMRKLDKNTFIAPLYSGNMIKMWLYAENMESSAIHPNFKQILDLPEYVGECHKRGIRVHPWTIDDPEIIKKLAEAGVDAVITNKPDVALAAVKM